MTASAVSCFVPARYFWYDAIYRYVNTLTPQPNLSESLADVSDDGKVWTIKLKPGLKFHDGSDLTSADVVQTYQLAASPNCRYNPSICLTGFTTAIEAVDDLTVKFTLKDPLATFARCTCRRSASRARTPSTRRTRSTSRAPSS